MAEDRPTAVRTSATRPGADGQSAVPPSADGRSALPPSPLRPSALRLSALRPSALRPSALRPSAIRAAVPPGVGPLATPSHGEAGHRCSEACWPAFGPRAQATAAATLDLDPTLNPDLTLSPTPKPPPNHDRLAASGDPAVAALQLALRQVGLRATPARVAVLDALYRATAPLSHADVGELLEGALWDRATLYRNLTDLAKAGLARRVDLGDHIWRFEVTQAGHQPSAHPHFVCTSCGSVACVAGVELMLAPEAAASPLFSQRLEVQLKGLCDGCR